MIQIPEQGQVDDIEKKIEALCEFLNVRLMTVATTTGIDFKVIEQDKIIPVKYTE